MIHLATQKVFSLSVQIQAIISGIILFIGLQLIFKPIPNELKNSYYYISRKIMGIAIVILPLLSSIYYFTNIANINNNAASAIKICGYYSTSSLVLIAFLCLIGENVNFKSRSFRLFILSFFVFPIYIWIGLKYGNAEITINISNTILFCAITGDILYLYIKYKSAEERNNIENNKEVQAHLEWIKRSKYMLIIFAAVACLAPTFIKLTIWVKIIYMIYTLIITTYIYESYNRFIIKYETIIKEKKINTKKLKKIEVVKEEAPSTQLNIELYTLIQNELEKWINRREYNNSNITIKTVSSDIGTNRTYLSSYINSTYNCSFKVWLKNLRLEEAKKLLCSDKSYTIENIAHMTGFSSQTSFIHVFRNTEGLPPAAWKAEHKL